MAKKMYIRNKVVYDPSIEFPDVFDDQYEEVTLLKEQYHAPGHGKKRRWRGP